MARRAPHLRANRPFHVYRSVCLIAAVVTLVGCRPEPVYIVEPVINRGGGPCGCWAPREVIEREVPEAERTRLPFPRELLAEVAVFRARARGAEPDTTRQCYGYSGRGVLVVGADPDSLVAALDRVGAAGSPSPPMPSDSLHRLRARLDVRQISELIRSPEVAAVSGPPVTCAYLTAQPRRGAASDREAAQEPY